MDRPVAALSPRPVRYRCGDALIDVGRRLFQRAGVEVALEPKVFAVVLVLLGRAGAIVTRDELLDAVWGHRYVTPSTLNRVIALARRAFGDDAHEPRFIDTVHGTGYRFVGAVEAVADAAAGVARFAPPAPVQLPARVAALVGRERELAELAAGLAAGRALTLVGPGGMGKTQCALECARRVAAGYPDGVWFFDLVAVPDADSWIGALAAAVGVRAADAATTHARIVAALAGRRLLLVLDNCDRLAQPLGVHVHALLAGADGVRVLATSQRALRFVGEQVFRMPPLALPAVHAPAGADLAALAAVPSVALLLARIALAQPAFELRAENAAALAEICVRLDGMPLALELAAARFALLSPDQVLERLNRRFRFLTSDEAGRQDRHRNLQALLEWSYALLSDDERRFLSWLGVFVGGWSIDALIRFARALGHDPETTVELLSGLVDKSLVSVDAFVMPPRYRLLETVREFALARLDAAGETLAARDAHVAAIGELAEAAHRDMLAGGMVTCIPRVAADFGNIEVAVGHALGRDPEAALDLVGALLLYMKGRGAVVAGLPLCQRALQAAPPHPTRARARALLAFGVNAIPFADLRAEEPLAAAIRIAEQVDDPWIAAYAGASLAMLLADRGNGAAARAAADDAEARAARLADRTVDGLVAQARAWLALAEQRTADAIALLLPVRRAGTDLHQHHFIEMYLGLAHYRLGERVAAAGYWLASMRLAIELGHVRGAAGGIEGCAYLEADAGRAGVAARLLGAAGQIRARTIPLYRWWHGHHAAALERVTAALGADGVARALADGAALREEDAINAATAALGEHLATPG